MLFPEEDEVHLKRWIVKRLENTSVPWPLVLLHMPTDSPSQTSIDNS